MLRYKIEILPALKAKGYKTTRLRSEKIFGEATIQKLRTNDISLSASVLETLCRLLECEVNDILEWIPNEK